jgi:serine phosphatase RsbU (regulator of sigma subunit)
VAGLQIAHRYQPAQAGGDWFDVIPLNDDRVALVVGDVTGHGIHAAAIMGQLPTTGSRGGELVARVEQLGQPDLQGRHGL